MEKGLIEVAPLAYMRGRTLDNAFIILDEAQNTTPGPDENVPDPYRVWLQGDHHWRLYPEGICRRARYPALMWREKVLSKVDDIGFCYLTSKTTWCVIRWYRRLYRHMMIMRLRIRRRTVSRENGRIPRRKRQQKKGMVNTKVKDCNGSMVKSCQ